jgi:hypothetical protein
VRWFKKRELAEIERLKEANSILCAQLEALKRENVDLYARPEKMSGSLYNLRNDSICCLYKTKNDFFTVSELRFFKNISSMLADGVLAKKKYFVFPKVRLADIVENWHDAGTWGDLQKSDKTKAIASEIISLHSTMDDDKYKKLVVYPTFSLHIDFLICKKTSDGGLTPALAIELDGDSRYRNKNNDALKSSIFDKIGKNKSGDVTPYRLELLRFKNTDIESPDFVNRLRREVINKLEAFEIAMEKREKH